MKRLFALLLIAAMAFAAACAPVAAPKTVTEPTAVIPPNTPAPSIPTPKAAYEQTNRNRTYLLGSELMRFTSNKYSATALGCTPTISGKNVSEQQIKQILEQLPGLTMADAVETLKQYGLQLGFPNESFEGFLSLKIRLNARSASENLHFNRLGESDFHYMVVSLINESNDVEGYKFFIFFKKTGDGYSPQKALIFAAWEADAQEFSYQEFAQQKWIIYESEAGHGTGYLEENTIWYNMDTNRIELAYISKYIEESPMITDGFVTERIKVATPPQIAADNEAVRALKIDCEITLSAGYRRALEVNIEDLEIGFAQEEANEPLALQTIEWVELPTLTKEAGIYIYYDIDKKAFYIHMPPEAYVLRCNKGEAPVEFLPLDWAYYFREEFDAMLLSDDPHVRAWAEKCY
ncbi:MAG: hypothetical protein LBN26_03235 [Christensenellaceae bacterium]|jgi:hypothetical protein|nr:hypothetical protein [Christensenellaceae bacterium]